ncbi:MAG: sialidase family protein, partial [Planctomycetota bacterium]
MTNRMVLTAFCATVFLAPAGTGAARGGEAGKEKLLVGFEIAVMKPKDGRGSFYKIGKVWDKGGVKAGWRWKDHEAELKLPADHDGDVTIYHCKSSSSRDAPMLTLFRNGATQGRYALRWRPQKCEARSWKSIARAVESKKFGYWPPPGVPTHGKENPYYFFQRYCKVWRYETGKATDWSGWDRLRFDALAPDAPVVLGVFVRDRSGPSLRCGPIGLRTDVAVFRVPKGEQVTVDFPLDEMAAIAELDLKKVYRYQCRINGYEGATDIYFDNVRLAKKDAPAKHKLITMNNEVKPFVRPVYYKPIERVAAKMKRESGPVEKLGPVDVGAGRFGGSGVTYVQNSRRACVAYDNKRLLVVARKSAWASFDGGETWGGIEPGSKGPTRLNWGLRANTCADYGGDVYMLGTPNCDSYNEGHDICMFRLIFTGEKWQDGYFSHLGQNGYKCTSFARALRLKTGRIWAAWCDGWGKGAGLAKYSDDDGHTWIPCKDAAKPVPRPFYVPELANLAKPAAERLAPPRGVLLWPATIVSGPFLV